MCSVQTYKANYEKTDQKGLICIPSGNHDMDRLARRLDPDEMKVTFAFLLSMPGAPFIYYGDEIGMRYVEVLTSVEGGFGRTGARSPMQWDQTVNAGFSSASKEKLYIKQDESTDRPTVESAVRDESSLYHEVKRLITLRQENKALQNNGTIEFISDGYPFIYTRSFEEQTILVVINPSTQESVFTAPEHGKVLYTIGEVTLQGENSKIAGCSAAFIQI